MDITDKQGSRWVARYEVAVDPQQYPRVHALLQQKDAFSEDFAANLERLAQEYLAAVEQHLADTASASAGDASAAADAPLEDKKG